MSSPSTRPLLLLVGGGGGFVGRALLTELRDHYRIRSVHPHRSTEEERARIEWIPGDVRRLRDWHSLLSGVSVIINLAWYRWESEVSFRNLKDGLLSLVTTAREEGVARFLHLSVPAAPPEMEQNLPYLRYKREVDMALAKSGLSYRIFRPTLLYGPGDRLLHVMMRFMHRYHFFPMFGDGRYHVSPLSVTDLACILHQEGATSQTGTLDLGGPIRYEYHDLTDRMWQVMERKPHYWYLTVSHALRLTRFLVAMGSSLLYPYEVEWLTGDWLGLPAYTGTSVPLHPVEDYLAAEAVRIARKSDSRAPSALDDYSRTP